MKTTTLTIALLMGCSNFVRAQNLTYVSIPKMLTTNLASLIKRSPESDRDYELKERAIREAGESHCTDPEVINALLDNLRYYARHEGTFNSPMQAPKYAIRPAWDALKDIGEPVIPFILERIKRGEDELPPGYVPPKVPEYNFTNSSNNSGGKIVVPLPKPRDAEIMSKVGKNRMLLEAIADKQSAALLQGRRI